MIADELLPTFTRGQLYTALRRVEELHPGIDRDTCCAAAVMLIKSWESPAAMTEAEWLEVADILSNDDSES